MICWYCHWGWPKQVFDIYRDGIQEAGEPAMHFGPGHIVWEDENFESENIQWCIDNAGTYRGDLTDEEVASVVKSLARLLDVPEHIRCCEPSDYDGANPEDYPPPPELVMVKRGEA